MFIVPRVRTQLLTVSLKSLSNKVQGMVAIVPPGLLIFHFQRSQRKQHVEIDSKTFKNSTKCFLFIFSDLHAFTCYSFKIIDNMQEESVF